jgi:uncharacterized membrane protein
MKIDQLIIGIYLAIGFISGYLSDYYVKLNNLTISLLLPLVIYMISQPILLKIVKQKKKRWLMSNSFVTFVLVWLLVWITLHNL